MGKLLLPEPACVESEETPIVCSLRSTLPPALDTFIFLTTGFEFISALSLILSDFMNTDTDAQLQQKHFIHAVLQIGEWYFRHTIL